MLSLEREIAAANPPDAAALLARERREIFSIHPELRALSWAGAILIATGAAMLLAKHYERIGPLAVAAAVGLAALAAYGYALWRRSSGGATLVDDYILLLAALLLSADLAFVEGEFHLLDHGWPRHLLLLAVIHAVTAYYFDSRTLLSLAIAALAGWMGVEQRAETFFDSSIEMAVRAMLCSAIVLLWHGVDLRARRSRTFDRVFQHFAANLALLGGWLLTAENESRAVGALLTVVIAAAVAWHGFRARAEAFVLYAWAYAFVAVMTFAVDVAGDELPAMLLLLIGSIAAIVGLFMIHHHYRKRAA